MSRNPLINTADAAGDGFATTENGILRVPGESPTTYQWQRYVERFELEVENKSLGHVLREANGPEHDKVPSHIDIEAELPVIVAGEGITARDVMRRDEQRAKAIRENTQDPGICATGHPFSTSGHPFRNRSLRTSVLKLGHPSIRFPGGRSEHPFRVLPWLGACRVRREVGLG